MLECKCFATFWDEEDEEEPEPGYCPICEKIEDLPPLEDQEIEDYW